MNNRPPAAGLLPHGPAARCLDAVADFEQGSQVVAMLTVRPELMLYEPARGGIPAWGAIEIMAQAAGLYLGLEQGRRGPAARRYLLGVKHFRARREVLACGAELRVEARCRAADPDGIASFDCRILLGGEASVSALLTLWRSRGEPGR